MILFLAFLLFQSPTLAAEVSCDVKTSTAEMPPPRTQGTTGFCYGFAATAVLQNFYCKSKSPPCQYTEKSNDQLSVLDALAIGNYGEGGLRGGGSTKQVLEKIGWQGKLAKESCAPFDPFLKMIPSPGTKEMAKLSQVVRSLNLKFLENKCSIEQRREMASALKTQAQLSTDVSQIVNALGKRDDSIILGEVLIPKQCEDQRVPLKKYKIMPLLGHDFASVRSTIQKQLKAGTPLVTHICGLPSPKYQQIKDPCGLHALVVSGIREKCCAGKCSYEYRFYDSTETFTGAEKSEDGWVSEATYATRLQRKWKSTEENENLYWLEPGT